MEITILHGENIITSRERYRELRRELKQKGPKDLFGEGDPSSLLWYPIALSQTELKKFPKGTKIEKFDLPKKLFSLIDNLGTQASLALSKEEPKELVFAMVGRQIRDIYWAKESIDTMQYPSWRISNLKRQTGKFTAKKLKELIALLSKLDLESKTGAISLPVALDLVLALSLE
ncbi:MAG: hypothetical protein AAB656_02670 [Patescibacteria group bacterium]